MNYTHKDAHIHRYKRNNINTHKHSSHEIISINSSAVSAQAQEIP